MIYAGYATKLGRYEIEAQTPGPVLVFETWLRKTGHSPERGASKPVVRVPMGRTVAPME